MVFTDAEAANTGTRRDLNTSLRQRIECQYGLLKWWNFLGNKAFVNRSDGA